MSVVTIQSTGRLPEFAGFFPVFRKWLRFAPASGNRNVGSGAVNNPGSNGYYWSSSPNSSTNGFNLNFNSSNVNPQNNNNRGNGFPVRCVQEFTLIKTDLFYDYFG